jgi:hypothetical protein
MTKRQREPLTVLVDPSVREVVERTAEREHTTISAVARRVISDWARSRQADQVAA